MSGRSRAPRILGVLGLFGALVACSPPSSAPPAPDAAESAQSADAPRANALVVHVDGRPWSASFDYLTPIAFDDSEYWLCVELAATPPLPNARIELHGLGPVRAAALEHEATIGCFGRRHTVFVLDHAAAQLASERLGLTIAPRKPVGPSGSPGSRDSCDPIEFSAKLSRSRALAGERVEVDVELVNRLDRLLTAEFVAPFGALRPELALDVLPAPDEQPVDPSERYVRHSVELEPGVPYRCLDALDRRFVLERSGEFRVTIGVELWVVGLWSAVGEPRCPEAARRQRWRASRTLPLTVE